MCADPVTVGLGLTAASTVLSTVSQFRQAQGQQAQLRSQSALQEEAARDRIERGRTEQNRLQLQTAELRENQRVASAANGVLVDSGSARDLVEDTTFQSVRDQARIEEDAEIEALNLRRGASLNRQRASSINPGTRAATTFIGGASRFADRLYRFNEGAT